MTLQDLRFWFDSEAPLQNGIPSITLDWSSDNMVLENVVDYPSPFTAPMMVATDLLLSQAANPYFVVPQNVQGEN